MRSTLFLTLLLSLNLSFGQNFNLTSQQLIGNTGDDELNKVIQTSDGGKLLLFSSYNNNGDRSSTNYGDADYWVVKMNNLYMIEWEKSFGGNWQDSPYSAVELSDGSFIIGGVSSSMPGTGVRTAPQYGITDYWIIKISATGTVIWDKSFGSSPDPDGLDPVSNILFSMALKNDTILLCGVSDGGIFGSKISDSFGLKDIWLVAVDTAGNELFQRAYGGSMEENFPTIKILDDQVLITCRSNSSVSGNKMTPGYGSVDTWIIKLDASYNIIHENTFGGIYSDFIYDLALKNGSYYFAGSSTSPVSGTKTSPKIGNMDCWVIKTPLDLQSSEQWSYGAVGNYYFSNIIPRPNGKLLLAGIAQDTTTGTWRTRAPQGGADFYMVGLDENGNYEWNYSWGGSDNDITRQIFESQQNNFEVFGISNSTVSGDISDTNHDSAKDGYWCTMNTNLSVSENNQQGIKVFPNPFTNMITIQTDLLSDQQVRIIDLKGNVILSKQISGLHTEINLNNLSSGIYFLKADHFLPVRLVKQ